MTNLIFLFTDQLSLHMSSLEGCVKEKDIILLAETREEATYVKHHKKKIVFQLSCMRHFAEDLRKKGYNVHYVDFDDPENTHRIEGEIARFAKKINANKIVLTEPSEWRQLQKIEALKETCATPVEVRQDTRFFCTINGFKAWAKGKTQLRMEFFYREMRKQYKILMNEKNKPEGDQWNFDKENRHPPKSGMTFPKRLQHNTSNITKDVIKLVEKEFGDHFGDIDPFYYAVTRTDALSELDHFIKFYLPEFGTYQDAMLEGEAFLNHSCLSAYINIGLLEPREICIKAEEAYLQNKAPLAAVEGFIRQILGWREYVRGIYWLKMPEYAELNFFEVDRPLPSFYWDAKTDMNCIKEAVTHTLKFAYSHHIQRLMVTGNFALLAGILPKEVCEWYLIVYGDAYDWVELPNTLGMALFGDGGFLGSKPYAASGKYIHKMSNFCKGCKYDPNEVIGENACPFNALYWNFLATHQKKLRSNQRLTYTYATWDKMNPEKKEKILQQAKEFLNTI